jgi:lipopolysaccharide transport system permease protein
MKEDKWDIILQPKRNLLDLNLKSLWRYRDLLLLFVKRDIIIIYKQTILGPLWFFIQPIMTTIIYIFVFGNIAKLPTDGLPQPIFYLSGIIMWNYFSECFLRTSDTFTQNAGVFGKVYFPRLITPISLLISNVLKFLIQFALFLAFCAYYWFTGLELNIQTELFIFPLLVLLLALTGVGFGLIFSSLTTKYKDLKFLIAFGVQLIMYATPVIYPMGTLPTNIQSVLWWNPLTHIIEAFKFVFLGAGSFDILGLSYSLFFASTVLFFGIVIFNKTEKSFMDTV